jgi:hypothetical protein
MHIKSIRLLSVIDTVGRAIETTLALPDSGANDPFVVRFHEQSGRQGCYDLTTIVKAAATREDHEEFIMHDGFDGTHDTSVPIAEIRRLAKAALTVLPVQIGEFAISVNFVPYDPAMPF